MRAVIDIGSNSVRLLIEGVKLKQVRTTRLAEGLADTGRLGQAAIERTAAEVAGLYSDAAAAGADKVYAFATEAVRAAANGGEFVALVKRLTGLDVMVLSAEQEAQYGFAGVSIGFGKGDLAVADIGGASVELALGSGGVPGYTHSRPMGVVRLRDMFGADREGCAKHIDGHLLRFRRPPEGAVLAGIGGTFTSAAAILSGIEVYDPQVTDGFLLRYDDIAALERRLWAMDDYERTAEYSVLQPKRAEVIQYGVLVIRRMMDCWGRDITVSESDNLEGFLGSLTLHRCSE